MGANMWWSLYRGSWRLREFSTTLRTCGLQRFSISGCITRWFCKYIQNLKVDIYFPRGRVTPWWKQWLSFSNSRITFLHWCTEMYFVCAAYNLQVMDIKYTDCYRNETFRTEMVNEFKFFKNPISNRSVFYSQYILNSNNRPKEQLF
jgi:hypothetical protein